ncbi:MAG: hypothetical protein M1828_006422 [Chrysothrix sp. TS-e1954]|nr:MAG: hypothetical protein M1828_006422 [Chrysothrix sp. TS-e1954]
MGRDQYSGYSASRIQEGTSRADVDKTVKEKKGPLGLTMLHNPEVAEADLILIHGLDGGSRSTWTWNGDESLYWPQKWLPHEPRLRNLRIRSFGYDINRKWRDGVLGNLYLVANELLFRLTFDESITHDSKAGAITFVKVPLLFVAHSLGGVILKIAVVLARLNDQYLWFNDRAEAFIFLATPHIFSGIEFAHNNQHSAHWLSNFDALNDGFRLCYQNQQLFSFYETRPTRHGKDVVILGKGSAFTAPANPNYLRVVDTLATVLNSIQKAGEAPSQKAMDLRLLENQVQNEMQVSETPVMFNPNRAGVHVAQFSDSGYASGAASSILGTLNSVPEAREVYVSLLAQDDQIKQLCADAASQVDVAHFERHLVRLLKTFAVDLKCEANTKFELACAWVAATFARHASSHIRKLVVENGAERDEHWSRLLAQLPQARVQLEAVLSSGDPTQNDVRAVNEDDHDGLKYLSEDNEQGADPRDEDDNEGVEEIDAPELPNLDALEAFLVGSDALLTLRHNLQSWTELLTQQTSEDVKNAALIQRQDSPERLTATAHQECSYSFHQDFKIADGEATSDPGSTHSRVFSGEEAMHIPHAAHDLLEAVVAAGHEVSIMQHTPTETVEVHCRSSGDQQQSASHAADKLSNANASTNTVDEYVQQSGDVPGSSKHDEHGNVLAERWLLLCFVDETPYAHRACHVSAPKALSDVDLIKESRARYEEKRGLVKNYLSLVAVTRIRFVKSRLAVDILDEEDRPIIELEWPPDRSWNRENEWDPSPGPRRPPDVGTWLLHYWYHDHESKLFRFKCLLRRSVYIVFDTLRIGSRASVSYLNNLARSTEATLPEVRPARRDTGRAMIPAVNLPTNDTELGNVASSDPNMHGLGSQRVATRGCFIYNVTPKKKGGRLRANPDEPPYGWGLLFEEDVVIPYPVKFLAWFLFIVIILGLLIYCIQEVHRRGWGVFGMLSPIVSLLAFAMTVILLK